VRSPSPQMLWFDGEVSPLVPGSPSVLLLCLLLWAEETRGHWEPILLSSYFTSQIQSVWSVTSLETLPEVSTVGKLLFNSEVGQNRGQQVGL
jgi:hypothetical protein